jgi:hypothetical protein
MPSTLSFQVEDILSKLVTANIAAPLACLFLAMAPATVNAQAPAPAPTPAPPPAPAPAGPDFGPNVIIFDPSMDAATMQSQVDSIYDKQQRNQFGSERYALFFKPGAYTITVNVGFNTQVYGLGKLPDDTDITGAVRSDARWMNGNGTDNFWRGIENLAITPAEDKHEDMWAVSQAAPFRRVHVKENLSLFDNGWTSGGYMADCKIDGDVISGSQQQWFARNNTWGEWKGGVWNMVFLGDTPMPDGTWPDKPFTEVESTPLIAEKPFVYLDAQGGYNVFVPGLRKDSVGISWDDGNPVGTSLPISQFYIAHSDKDTSATINKALSAGQNLLLTPGIYKLDDTLQVTNANTVILGLGMATLFPQKGNSAMEIADVSGVRLANVLFDAGATESPVLLQVGPPGSTQSHADNPTIIQDVFCRVGGAAVGVSKTCIVINSSDVIGDHSWIWRADHGDGVGWDQNKSTNGLIVNGANVTYYGLFVEHFQEDQTLWNGENGRVYFYQCEMPYDPPSQDKWIHGSVKGYPGFKVADNVKTFEAWGLGIYCVFNQDNIYADTAMEVPDTSGVKVHHVLTVRLSGKTEESGINNVINTTGGPAPMKTKPVKVPEYPPDLSADSSGGGAGPSP